MKLISFIIPVYNEEKNIPPLINRVKSAMALTAFDFEIIFCMDPCSDNTELIILREREKEPRVKLICLSRRFGQPAATLAGLSNSLGDACIILDADLQDPPELAVKMCEKWQEGYDVVFAQRMARNGETFFYRAFVYVGYWLINKISDLNIPRNTGDFRLLSRRVVNEIVKMKDHEGFLRGLVAYAGFRQVAIPFNRESRHSGSGKYNPFFGSLRIGLNGIFGFSKYPLNFISMLGLFFSGVSFLVSFAYLFCKIFSIEIIWGNPTLVILITFFTGIQLFCLGIIGQYISRIYDDVKDRPIYIIDQKIGFQSEI